MNIDNQVGSKIVQPAHDIAYDPTAAVQWWEQIPENFHRLQEEFHLDFWNQLRIQSVSASDYLFRSFVSVMFSLANIRKAIGLMGRDYRSLWEFYKNPEFKKNPNLFFKRAEVLPPIIYKRVWTEFNLPDGVVYDLKFQSPFKPVNPDMNDIWAGTGHPDFAYARLFTHKNDLSRPTIVCLHGFVVDRFRTNSYVFDVANLYRQGFNVLLYTMPYHGKRKTPTARFSGDGFISVDAALINETVAHSVHDLRIFMDHLRAHGVSSMGMTGISLGGYTTALMAGIEDDLKFAVLLVPVTSFIDLALEWEPMSTLIRTLMKVFGHSVPEVRQALAVHTPLNYAPRIAKENLFIISGAGDRMASPKQSQLIWEHWGRPDIHWFVGNHLIHIERRKYMEKLRLFFQRIGMP